MFERYGLPAIAIVGLIILAIPAWLLIDQQNKREATYQASLHEYENTKGDLAPGVALEGKRSIPDPKSYREEWRNEYDLEAQRDMAKWALYALIVSGAVLYITAIGIVYVARTLKANRDAVAVAERALEATRISNERQLRAYVNVTGAFMVWGNGRTVEIKVHIKNAGQTPARTIRHYCHMGIGNRTEFETSTANPAPTFDLGPGSEIEWAAAKQQLNDAQWTSARNRQLPLYFWGSITYNDIFGDVQRCTKYRMILAIESDDLLPCEEGNDCN